MLHTFIKTFIIFILSIPMLKSAECPSLDSVKEQVVAQYIQKRYSFPANNDIKVVENMIVPNSCYRKLKVQSSMPNRTFVVYLSPDQRFITPVLMDLIIDPIAEMRAKDAAAERLLTSEGSPVMGSQNAPITIVEFSDFQCPFCSRIAAIFDSLPELERRKVKIVFKQLPLPMHQWSATAARLTACTARQNNDAFWRAHDFIFSNQANITPENINQLFNEFVQKDSRIDATQLKNCVADKSTDDLLTRDQVLADKVGVRGTPTLFANGKRMESIKNVGQLITLIHQINGEAAPPVAASTITNTAGTSKTYPVR
jgi:protein-disulfide isomerase